MTDAQKQGLRRFGRDFLEHLAFGSVMPVTEAQMEASREAVALDYEEPAFMERTPVRRRVTLLADVNAILRAAGYRMGERGGVMKDRDLDKLDDAIKYGVSPDEFADMILTRDGFREPMTTADASLRWPA